MKKLTKLSSIILIVLVGISVFSCKNNNEIEPIWTPSQILSSTAWETTNEKGENISLTHSEVIGSVGFAYFKPNGDNDKSTYYDIIHKPTTHQEPTSNLGS